MLGVPEADRDELRALGRHRRAPRGGHDRRAAGGHGGGDAPARLLRRARRRARAHAARRPHGALLAAEIDGDRLDDVEILGFLFLMIIAGNETTTKLLGNALYWLWRNPEQRALVRGRSERSSRAGSRRRCATTARRRRSRARVTGDVELHGETHARRRPRGAAGRLGATATSASFRTPTATTSGATRAPCCRSGRARTSASARRSRGSRRASRSRRCSGACPTTRSTRPGIARVHSVNVRGFAALPIDVHAGRDGAAHEPEDAHGGA